MEDEQLDGEILHIIGEEFYKEYKALVQKHIDAAPEHLRDEVRMRLGELSNPYSC